MKPFQFKEFVVHQDKTAMKIGTDGVLLGAWTRLDHHPDTILDVGSGTGVIALMMAQRSNAMTIDAVEINEAAYEQTVDNFEQSDWGDRLFCYNASFQEFAEEFSEEEETYELIVSNPPFYTDDYETNNEARNEARFTSSLSFESLLKGVALLLDKNGVFTTILPYKEESSFIALATSIGLYVTHICRVKGNDTSPVKRSLMAFSFEKKQVVTEQLTIEKERHQYTDAYINLTKDFYFKM